ncbi:ATP-dependent DNA helicase DinG [Tepidimonas alkaliphilus]|nr:ATP-dependent DNA helicase DinG [Tepidimonas alkaliphilus]
MDEAQALAQEALAEFDGLIARGQGLKVRPGQRAMAACVAETLAQASVGGAEEDGPTPPRRLAVVEAGTGVGKSLAYLVPAIAVALQRGTRVVVSTATVALQEQLVRQDLPALAAQLPTPFRYALAKGRGRYVCRLKLERWLADPEEAGDGEADDDLLAPLSAEREAQRLAWLHARAADLAHGRWDGELDSLPQPPEPAWWAAVAADAASCSARHCPLYGECVYFERRKELVGAQVLVVNHDLLLATLGTRQLPELDQCLLVLDEAHHLPATALAQWASRAGLTRLAWIDQLASRMLRTALEVECDAVADVPDAAARLRAALQELARLAVQTWGGALRHRGEPLRVRWPLGRVPPGWAEPLRQAAEAADALLAALRALGAALRGAMRKQPEEARRLAQLYAQLGTLAPRLEATSDTVRGLAHEPQPGQPPLAKWLTLTPPAAGGDGSVRVVAHASPIQPGALLRARLWPQVRGAVLTSATLTGAGGRFDFFLREVGLADDPDVTTRVVESPFDHARQGELVLAGVTADPRDLPAYQQAVQQALLRDLPGVRQGALVLFTSRAHLRQVAQALPPELRERVLVQGELPRAQLLQRHRERVGAGQPSILFGLQSFGEGLDLPGALCADLFITKLPFAPPDDPVGEARAEWLRASGRDPFLELVVPATALRLQQWVGRALRSEDDRARIVCYDPRLTATGYGRMMLAGLPPFRRVPAAQAAPLEAA